MIINYKLTNFHKHKWGGEIYLVNTELYCSKFIILNRKAQSSYHYHIIKDEMFYILQGEVELELGKVNNKKFKKVVKLKQGDKLRLKPNEDIHRFKRVTKRVVILETSTTDRVEDNVKLEESK